MNQAQAVRAIPGVTSRAEDLLMCGVIAAPVFVVATFVHAITRSGFDFTQHPLSLLTLGGLGWVQTLIFVLSGALFVASTFGMRRVLGREQGGTWGPRLIAFFGVGLIAGGIFVPDAAFGFPPGSPGGVPEQLSWHGIGHAVAFTGGFAALVASSFVFARRDSRFGSRAWAAVSRIVGVGVLVLSMWPNIGDEPEGRFAPLWIAMVLGLGWASTVAVRFMKDLAGREKRDEFRIGAES